MNTLVEPKIIYLTQTLDIPTDILKQINKHIRTFIFKGTISNIRHTTLIQDKKNGGINLHDIRTKTKAFRLKYMKDVINNREQYPLAHYYIGTHITKHITIDNTQPHHFGYLPTFYKTCIATLKNHPLLINKTTTKAIYKEIVQTLATPLYEQIKRGTQYALIDLSDSITNLHIPYTTAIQKQITYRLLFTNTPVSSPKCTTCRKNVVETEEHVFFFCPCLKNIKQALYKFLNTKITMQTDIYKAIFLNMIPKQDKQFHTIKLIILALYRDTAWTVRLQTKFSDKHHTSKTILDIFIHKLKYTLTKHELWAAFERMTD